MTPWNDGGGNGDDDNDTSDDSDEDDDDNGDGDDGDDDTTPVMADVAYDGSRQHRYSGGRHDDKATHTIPRQS